MIPPTPSTKPRSTKFCMVLNPPDLIAAVRHRITQAALDAMGGETIEMGLSEQRIASRGRSRSQCLHYQGQL